MKNEDKITQIYQDAFKDFAVEAPSSIQAGALNQLGRRSLLTLDPTRLNIFYLALISGAIAWGAISSGSESFSEKKGLSPGETVELSNENSMRAIEAAETSGLSEDVELSSQVVETDDLQENSSKNTSQRNVEKSNQTSKASFVASLEKSTDEEKTTSVSFADNKVSSLKDEPVEMEETIISEYIEELEPKTITCAPQTVIELIPLTGARVQNESDFLRKLALSSKAATLTVEIPENNK